MQNLSTEEGLSGKVMYKPRPECPEEVRFGEE
jgi:hypothetical protein